ncbi:MAG: hypothetical protein E7235_05290 [Lachnospiraceae bacterium]|nr:hypothetical protein [Lachnospiraceae bacterium]
MFCDKCNKNQATLHYTKIVNGKKYEQHLCNTCAGDIENTFAFDDMFKNVFTINPAGVFKNSPEVKKCERCGLTLDELNKYGRLGCADCCVSFREYIEPVLKSIHSVTRHNGKRSGKISFSEPREDKIAALKAKLKEAIKNEEYEKAAEIRDILKELEKEA